MADRKHKTSSMSWNLTLSLMVAVIAVSAVEIAFNYLNASRKAEMQLESKADEYIAFLESSLQYALWYVDQPTIRRIGESFSKDELIVSVKISDTAGKNLFVFSKNDKDAVLRREKTVFHNGQHAGNIQIALSYQYYNKMIWSILRSSLITIGMVLLSLIMLTGLLLRIFLREPLRHLTQIVDSYTSGNYDISEVSYTEFYPFVALLRKMGNQIRMQIRELKAAEKRYRSIFENAIEGIFQTTPQGQFLNANPSLANIFGYDSAEELMSSVSDIPNQLYVCPENRKILESLLREYHRVRNFKSQFYRKDGSTIWGALSVRLIRNHSEDNVRYEGSVIDITEQVQAEEALKKHREHLEEMVAERTSELLAANEKLQIEIRERRKIESELQRAKNYLEEALKETGVARETAETASRSKSEFLANMSHEIRTPMNAIMGLSHLLLQDGSDTKQKDYLNKIHGSARSLLKMINNILDFSKIESGKSAIKSLDFNLDDFINALLNRIRKQVREKGLNFSVSLDETLPKCLVGDPLRLRQVLAHLLENAVKFTENGEIAIGAVLKHSVEGRIWVQFMVRDTGIGIPQEKLPMLFDVFTQADSSLTRKFKGMGLGLAICRRLITLMGGEISAESEPGKGSVFTVTCEFGLGEQNRHIGHISCYDTNSEKSMLSDSDIQHIPEEDKQEIRDHIIDLWNFLKKRDIRAVDSMEILRQDMNRFGLEDRIIRLEKHIADYDFGDALDIVEAIGSLLNIPLHTDIKKGLKLL